ncbi:PHD finger protein 12 [Cydia amplana]|uniref:PHD finger protein 12 n=1 Tax=Cydia amplana TaxID=1869771 RepID=UPI002FE5D42F
MSNVSYDLDTSGGLMPLIKALIKPPDEEVNNQKSKKPQHPYYKRPGKGHNRDSCDACGEGGDLICCDRCPASFHLGCYDPPLDANDIPAGLWLCRECQGSDEQPPSARSSRAVSPADSKDSDKKTRSLRNRSNSTKKTEEDEKDKDSKEREKEDKELTPMEILVKAAKVMNPRQFELPREMRVPCPFPGTEKENGNGNGKNGNGLVTVDAWGCVPLPAKSCFVCRGTCKAAPLLACDYCPLLFHQDCLDPPLTALPTGRWMCPNHVEQYIDWKLVNSVSASERVALWERFSAPPDQQAIKIDFIRRARAHRPPFRVKVPVGVRGRVVVPGMVRQHYADPPPLQPSRREYVRCRNVLKNLQATSDYEASDEDEDAPKHTICLNLSCTKHNGEPQPRPADLKGASEEDAADDLKAITQPKEEAASTESDHSDSDIEYEFPVKRRRETPSGEDVLRAAVDDQLKKLDQSLIKLLAWQRLQQILVGEQCHGPWSRLPLSPSVSALVQAAVPRARLAKHGYRHVALPSELLTRAERERIARAVWGAAPPPPRVPTREGPPEAVYKHGYRHVALPSELLTRAERERIARAVWGAAPPPPRVPTREGPPEAVLRAAACPVLRPAADPRGAGADSPRRVGRRAAAAARAHTRGAPRGGAAGRRLPRAQTRQVYKHGYRHVALPSELLTRAERERIARAVWGAAPPPPRVPTREGPPEAVLRAAACPVLRPAADPRGAGADSPRRVGRRAAAAARAHTRGAPRGGAAGRRLPRAQTRQVYKHGYRHVALPSELLTRAERERIARAVWGAAPPPPRVPTREGPPEAVLRAAACPVLRPGRFPVKRRRETPSGADVLRAAVDYQLKKLDQSLIKLLAWQKLQQLPKIVLILKLAIFPYRSGLGDGLGRPIPMRLSRLTFGADSSCDVVLDPTQCRYVSRLHATIFYDEVTRHFELINYSEWGSRVDGVLYTMDVSEREAPVVDDEAEARAKAVRDVVRHRMQSGTARVQSAPASAACPPCRCSPPPPAPAAWEGGALVAHGALLQLGCLMFVFSVPEPRA